MFYRYTHSSSDLRLRSLYNYYKNSFPELNFDVNEALEKYKVIAEVFRPMTIDTIGFLNKCVKDGSKKIVIEGAQGTMLDIDFGKCMHLKIIILTKVKYDLDNMVKRGRFRNRTAL